MAYQSAVVGATLRTVGTSKVSGHTGPSVGWLVQESGTVKNRAMLMPHLLILNRSYYPDLGSTGQLLTELCEDLVRCYGWEVTVVAGPAAKGSGRNGRLPGWMPVRREFVHGVCVLRASGTRFSKAKFPGRATNYVSYLASASVAGLRARRPNVVMSLTDPPLLGTIALAWARVWNVPFVFLCQDVFPEGARALEDFRSPAVEQVLERVNRLLVRHADRVVAIGETMKERLVTLRGTDPAKVTVIHNWGDRRAIAGGGRDSAFCHQNDLFGRFVVMHAGNLGLTQGLETLVDAATLLARDCPKLEVVFVGDGAKREPLEHRARATGVTNVRFLPFLPRERMRESYGTADLCVISLKRGLGGFSVPSKLYAILAAGKPYVAAVDEDSEVATITRRFRSGTLVPPGDAPALAEQVRLLYHDPSRLQTLAAGAKKAATFFDRPVAVGAYHELLSGLL